MEFVTSENADSRWIKLKEEGNSGTVCALTNVYFELSIDVALCVQQRCFLLDGTETVPVLPTVRKDFYDILFIYLFI
jgi:hypothetical protein